MEASHLAAAYLAGAVDAEGRFAYVRNLHPRARLDPTAYNVLRHAGTLYAMAQYQRRFPRPEVRAALLRGARYLQRHHLGPVPGQAALVAAWEDDLAGSGPGHAKLGGAGLALTSLCEIEAVAAGTTPRDTLRALGRFVAFMQQPSGAFYSKYKVSEVGRFDQWQSLYYPGEAALGMARLYELDGDGAWLSVAARALAYLADTRRGDPSVPADHWALIATERVLAHFDELGAVPFPRELLVEHAEQICRRILAERDASGHPPGAWLHGSFDAAGRTTPAATRLEGLIAAAAFVPTGLLRRRIVEAVEQGVRFLARVQIDQGPLRGGMPRVAPARGGAEPRSPRAGEVRIDYVQHALSAWLGVMTRPH